MADRPTFIVHLRPENASRVQTAFLGTCYGNRGNIEGIASEQAINRLWLRPRSRGSLRGLGSGSKLPQNRELSGN